MSNDLDIFSALSSIRAIVNDLSEGHLRIQECMNTERGSALRLTIASSLRELSTCIKIVDNAIPAMRLPQDILGVIFEAVKDANPSDSFSVFRMSHVSQSWRRAAHSPLLWTAVEIVVPFKSDLMIRAWLSKSQLLPLDLRLECSDKCSSTNATVVSRMLFKVLDPHIARCRSITIYATNDSLLFLYRFQQHYSTTIMPLLEALCFHIDTREETQITGLPMLVNAPGLAKVRMAHSSLDLIRPPLTNVTLLSLDRNDQVVDFSDLRSTLSRCPRVQTLNISGGIYDTIYDTTDALEKLALPELFSLSITNDYQTVILAHISAPVLNHLLIDGCDVPILKGIHSPENVGPSSFPSLRTLKLSLLCHAKEDLIDILKMSSECFPHVEDLTLSVSGGTDAFGVLPSLLAVKGGLAWPCLQQLSLGGGMISDESKEDALYSFIGACKDAQIPLQRLYMSPAEIELLTRLDRLRTQVEVVGDDWQSTRSKYFGIYHCIPHIWRGQNNACWSII